ncbi:hypothetical protein DNTS_030274 [Danionella cerebrum]|uniref:VWFD domain-containing protein n=1 Tax=Danionella cerebrum TaxID=2873325 RepID=A0A553RPM1_9TELE|nr:hypothetical protein DNTS_030274 [Danionella translucida]
MVFNSFSPFLIQDGSVARTAGREFATAFMQNYISPFDSPLFQLYLTSLNSDSVVKITIAGLRFTQEVQLTPGQSITVTLPSEVELSGSKRSRNTALIQASEEITVSSLNSKQYTADTSLVYPVTEWGTEYLVFTPANSPASMFKEFVLINGKEQNTVELFLRAAVRFEGRLYPVGGKLVLALEPFENAQIQSQGDLTGTRISSQLPIAVYSGHTCTWRFSKCNHVYEQLLPVQSWGTQFLMAPMAIQSQYDSIYVQTSQATNITIQSGRNTISDVLQRGVVLEYKIQFPDGLSIIADSGIQVFFLFNGLRTSHGALFDPFLINLLPVSHFCSSYELHGIADFDNRALLIIPTGEQTGIRFNGSTLPENVQWRVIKNSEYSWTELHHPLGTDGNKIYHPSASFGVYSVGFQQANGYGAPAPCTDPGLLISSFSCIDINCMEDEECVMKDSIPTCVKRASGICWAMGDPHYCSFDRRYFDFMGTCTYVITRSCQQNGILPYFEILAKNEQRDDLRVSYVAQVTVHIGGVTFTIVGSKPGKVLIDQSEWNLPVILDEVGVSIFHSGNFVTILFSFGVNLQYDWNHFLMVSLPNSFMNKVCGLCGNFNGDPSDDFTMPLSTQAPNATVFGQSWKVHNSTFDSGCRDDNPGHECGIRQLKQWQTENYCGLLMKGAFSQCHSVIDPVIYMNNCGYDVCMADGNRDLLCKAFEVYARVCQHAGIQLINWREAANCSYRCPENSRYEFCGNACPLTCMSLASGVNCTLPCVETCTCNPGFVLSESKCVPSSQCGCSFKGRYVPAGETFWADDVCQHLCHCSTEGSHLKCQDIGCEVGQSCQIVNGTRGCHSVPQSTCVALSHTHYHTFDGNFFDFQGSCVYQLVGVCAFSPGLVNEELMNLPLSLVEGYISVFKSGWHIVLQTLFGLNITFDWNSFVSVSIPTPYMGSVCGLCGNYNGNPDDDLILRGATSLASGPVEFGMSWMVSEIPDCTHGCSHNCQSCDPIQRTLYGTSEFCGLLKDPQGPFSDCHGDLDPASFFDDCVSDVCLFSGSRDTLCQAITAYVSACQAKGKSLRPWRTAGFCALTCPPNSHYSPCAPGCPETCAVQPEAPCSRPCTEACQCDPGFILSGQTCVPPTQCGCFHQGRYYNKHQQFYIQEQCLELCTCGENGSISCEASSCGPGKSCRIVNGVFGCHPDDHSTCLVTGDPHYVSFDGRRFDFQGTCVYILAKVCDWMVGRLNIFSVEAANEPVGHKSVSIIKNVTVAVYNWTVTIRRGELRRVIVST